MNRLAFGEFCQTKEAFKCGASKIRNCKKMTVRKATGRKYQNYKAGKRRLENDG